MNGTLYIYNSLSRCKQPFKPLKVNVVDVLGRKMFAGAVSSLEFRLDVSQWPSGIYFIQMEQDGRRFGRKFLKR